MNKRKPKKKCKECGSISDPTIEWCVNPYESEINYNDDKCWLCETCCKLIADEI